MIKTYLGDCLKTMDSIPNNSVDLILCDLPYGETHNKEDIIIPFDLLWKQYERIIKDNGAIALFAQGLFYIDLVNSKRNLFRYDLVWDKILTTGFLNAKIMPLRQHEQIAVFYKNTPTYNPQFTTGKPLHSKGISYMSKEIKNENYGEFHPTEDTRAGSTQKYPTSIVKFQKPHPSAAKHRTEKPIELLEYIIKTYTNEQDTVLDNCMGSASTGIACLNTNRNFIGIEKNEKIYESAKERLSEHTFNILSKKGKPIPKTLEEDLKSFHHTLCPECHSQNVKVIDNSVPMYTEWECCDCKYQFLQLN